MPREAEQGPSTLGGNTRRGCECTQAQTGSEEGFYAFTLFLPFSACDGCWRQTRWPWRAAEGPKMAPVPCPAPTCVPEAPGWGLKRCSHLQSHRSSGTRSFTTNPVWWPWPIPALGQFRILL